MKLGMVGLPNVGKSTLFNALSNGHAESANYPFCTIEPNIGVVSVPDIRLERLADIYDPDKFTPATLEFMDIAGLVKGASKGEGLGNRFLGDVRQADALIHVVRCFEDENIVHVDGEIDAVRDADTIQLELIFADIEHLQKRMQKVSKMAKGNSALAKECEFFKALLGHLEEGKSARSYPLTSEEEKKWISELELLSLKPVIYAANLSEDDFIGGFKEGRQYTALLDYAEKENAPVFAVCAKLEQEMNELSQEDKQMFLTELGLKQSGLSRIIQMSYDMLGLISYLTAGKQEVRAWTIKKGTKAPQAAGKIHSDFERGFIRAEIISYDDFIPCGNMQTAKEKGLVRLEGKDYVMQDGDIVLFRFNVS